MPPYRAKPAFISAVASVSPGINAAMMERPIENKRMRMSMENSKLNSAHHGLNLFLLESLEFKFLPPVVPIG